MAAVLAEVIPIRTLIALSFGAMLVAFLPLLFSSPVRTLLNFDSAIDSPESMLR